MPAHCRVELFRQRKPATCRRSGPPLCVNLYRFRIAVSQHYHQAAAGADAAAVHGRLSAWVALLALILRAAGLPGFKAEVCQKLTNYALTVWRQSQGGLKIAPKAFTSCLRGVYGAYPVRPRCVPEVDIIIACVCRYFVAIMVCFRRVWRGEPAGPAAVLDCSKANEDRGVHQELQRCADGEYRERVR